jgi:hypothetical protein
VKILVLCLGLKSARHFSLFDENLLKSHFDIKYVVVASNERMERYRKLIPDTFEEVLSSWTPSDQSAFYKTMLFFRTISHKSFRSHSIQWLRFAIFGNEIHRLNLKLALSQSYLILRFIIKYLKQPLRTIFTIMREGSLPSDKIRLPAFDEMQICNLLESEKPDCVVIQSTLSDLTLYNILYLLQSFACPSLVIVDSWDNIGTRPMIPNETNKYLVHSQQQILVANKVYGLEPAKMTLFGTPRIPQIREVLSVKRKSVIRIGYLQGLPADDLELNLKNLTQSMQAFLQSQELYSEFTILIRPYPIKTDKVLASVLSISNQFGNRVAIQSLEHSLEDLFECVDFIVSEVTTAGIEAACAGLPTIFIASNSHNLYMNGETLLKSFHSIDLEPKGFAVLRGANVDEDRKKLSEIIFNYREPELHFFVYTDNDKSISLRLVEEINGLLHK